MVSQSQKLYLSGEVEVLLQDDIKLKSRILDPGMGVEKHGDSRAGCLMDIKASCTVKMVGTNVVVHNIPGHMLTAWNVCLSRY